MNNFVFALLSGMFVTFIYDFFIFLGIKLNYIDFYEIPLYYNILFADNQNFWVYMACSLFFGYFVIYSKNVKLNLSILSLGFLLSLATLIHDFGYAVGESLLMQKNVTLHDKKYAYVGDIIYAGRTEITFYDYTFEKVIQLQKKELVE